MDQLMILMEKSVSGSFTSSQASERKPPPKKGNVMVPSFNLFEEDGSEEEEEGREDDDELDGDMGMATQLKAMQKLFLQASESKGQQTMPGTAASSDRAAAAAPLPNRGIDSSGGLGGGQPGGLEDMMRMMIMMNAQALMKGQHQDGDGVDFTGIDGLRAMKAMTRFRTVKNTIRRQPKANVSRYRQEWEDELDAAGKPWSWRDVGKVIGFGKFRSMLRVFVMLGEIERLMQLKEYQQAHSQVVQSMKSVHQFSIDGHWGTAWKLTFLPDPIDRKKTAATDAEIEAVLGSLKAEEELMKRTKASVNGQNEKDKDKDKEKDL